MQDQDKIIQNKKNNFIISLGCNPGNVSIWAMYALEKINQITKKFDYKSYADLANKLGLRVIHVSERDSQITNNPKKKNEYVNTWSSNAKSWYDEAFSFLEISWGTHEKNTPDNINKKLSNEYQLVLDGEGYNSYAYSYTPLGKNLVGMLIRHEECYTICRKLTIKNDKNEIIYKPSCYYVYKPNDSSVASTYEIRDNIGKYQENKRLMTSDIIEGKDELGCTLFFANGDIYWIGSLLDIKEARLIYDNEYDDIINATVLQVVAGYIGAILYLIESIENKKYKGLLTPEELPIKKFVKVTKPMLGPFGLIKVEDWTVETKPDKQWQFEDFVFN
jgi:homospermidine synthase